MPRDAYQMNQTHEDKSQLTKLFGMLCCLFALEFLFVLLDIWVNWLRWSDSGAIRRMFNITREDGLPSLFAVLQTFVVACVLWLIVLVSKPLNVKPWRSLGWLILALFFTIMTIDDGAKVHERIGTAFKSANADITFTSYGWQYVVAPVYICFGGFMFFFLWLQPENKIKRNWLLVAIVFQAAAMGLDFVEGIEGGYTWLTELTGWHSKLILHYSKSLEEFLEMAAITLLLGTFLNYLILLTDQVEIQIRNRKIILKALR